MTVSHTGALVTTHKRDMTGSTNRRYQRKVTNAVAVAPRFKPPVNYEILKARSDWAFLGRNGPNRES